MTTAEQCGQNILKRQRDVRFTPNSGHEPDIVIFAYRSGPDISARAKYPTRALFICRERL